MASRKRKKINKSSASVDKRGSLSTEEGRDGSGGGVLVEGSGGDGAIEEDSWGDLPKDLLEVIISQLSLKENLRASVVCKNWLSVAISVRVVNKPSWLMLMPKAMDLVEFYDPLKRVFHVHELTELRASRICYARNGWLLVYKLEEDHRMFFLNPYNKNTIELPKFEMQYQVVAFSAAPTSSSCVIFTIRHVSPSIVAISTCKPGATAWTNINFRNRLPFISTMWNKLVFSDDKFYCLSITGGLGVFDPNNRSWTVQELPSPRSPDKFCSNNWWKRKFMAEHHGDIFIVYTSSQMNPVIYRLDKATKGWVEMKTLGGLSIFASFLCSHVQCDLLGTMRDRIYFPKVRYYGKCCISYSPADDRYYPKKQQYNWGEENPLGSIWIEPPEDLSCFES